MEKNLFVNYEQALKLKSIEFDEPCMFVHDTWGNIINWTEDGEGEHKNSHVNASIYYSAPLKSQVFKWFRDEHKLWVSFAYDEDESEELYWYVDKILKYGIGRLFFHDLIEYKTYEEAESSCIDKLIELIKEKKS